MDFTQKKLTRAEWESIETPIEPKEKEIVEMICRGYYNVGIRENQHTSLFSVIKISPTKEMEFALYQKYFQPLVANIFKRMKISTSGVDLNKTLEITKAISLAQMKTADKIRMQNLDENICQSRGRIFEFLLLNLCAALVDPLFSVQSLDADKKDAKDLGHKKPKNHPTAKEAIKPPIFYVYTLNHLKKTSIANTNAYVKKFVDLVLQEYQTDHSPVDVLFHSYECIEKNPYLIAYEDRTLFPHQKRLFQIVKSNRDTPKLILYIAPTGTGKTLSPIALSQEHRVIFVCVARHVGFALAQSAISVGRKIATAFGCDTPDGVRLHNNAAKDFIRNKRSGGIGKIDHLAGDNVELMICDVQSYIPAMNYMLSFNDPQTVITFWDEPTMTLDKPISTDYEIMGKNETHPPSDLSGQKEKGFEEQNQEKSIAIMIHQIWKQNRVPKLVLSCATLPTEEELLPVLADFRNKFEGAEIHTVSSVDCRKSIGIINSEGLAVLPHSLYSDYSELMNCVRFCESDLTILRYFDLREIIRFLHMVADELAETAKTNYSDTESSNSTSISALLRDALIGIPLDKINLQMVKEFYLTVLKTIDCDDWPFYYEKAKETHCPRFPRKNTGANSSTKGLGTFEHSTNIRKVHSVSDTAEHESTIGKPISKIHSIDSSMYSTSQTKPTNTPAQTDPYYGILFTTLDAHTLTDGPTLYLAENVEKIGQFYIQQSHISTAVFQKIQAKIQHNDSLAKEIAELETALEAEQEKKSASLADASKQTKPTKKGGGNDAAIQGRAADKTADILTDKITLLKSQICNVSLDPIYIPNHPTHAGQWAPTSTTPLGKMAVGYYMPLDEAVVREIMTLDIEGYLKLLLLMGIGVFTSSTTSALSEAQNKYLEIMKGLAKDQRLFLIIANSDYIYGTNYQFCHGIIGKDLVNMTQQKQKQAMGRIGRHNIQHEYTVRFRNDGLIRQLWTKPARNIEAENMCLLFCSD